MRRRVRRSFNWRDHRAKLAKSLVGGGLYEREENQGSRTLLVRLSGSQTARWEWPDVGRRGSCGRRTEAKEKSTISIKSRPVFGPARNSRSFNQSRPRPAVRTELPTFDSSTRINSRACREPSESFFRIQIQINYVRAVLASTRFSAAGDIM